MELSLAGWSLHRRFERTLDPLLLLDYPSVVVEEFGLILAELNSPFFEYADADDPARSPIKPGYIDALRRRTDEAGIELVGIAVDHHGDLSAPTEAERRAAVENHRKWFDVARTLGCAGFRANASPYDAETTDERVEQAIRSFGELAKIAEQTGVRIMIENHGGITSDPEVMVRIVESVDSAWFGTLPDFGNFPPTVDRYAALARIAPYAFFVHAKFHEFESSGDPVGMDVPRLLEIFADARYAGPFGIEFEGPGDEHDGACSSIAVMRKYGE